MNYIKLGQAISRAKVSRCGDNDYPVLSITMKDGIVMQSDKFKKRIASKDISEYKVIPAGMLVQGIHIDEGNFGIQDIVPYGIVSPAYTVWTVDESVVFPKYIEMVLRSPRCIDYYRSKLNGTVNRRGHMSEGDFLGMQIPCPSIEEQKHVVTTMNQVKQVMISLTEEMTAHDQLIKARFVEMFGDIRETVPLSYYIDSLVAGKSLAGEEECSNKVLKTGAATYDYFDPSQVKNLPKDYVPLPEHLIHDGDVIISRMNTAELVGAAAYIWAAPENTYLPDRLWRAELTDKANPIFVWQSIIQPTTKEAIRRIAGGTSGSMKNISKPGLLGLHVKKVDMRQQNMFASFVSQVDKSKVVVQEALDKAQLLFDSLMQQYFG